jgi:hypothetical protein
VILAAFTALNLVFSLYVTAGFFAVYVVLGVLLAMRLAKGIVRASVAIPAASS